MRVVTQCCHWRCAPFLTRNRKSGRVERRYVMALAARNFHVQTRKENFSPPQWPVENQLPRFPVNWTWW
jgi:hypothetical protein